MGCIDWKDGFGDKVVGRVMVAVGNVGVVLRMRMIVGLLRIGHSMYLLPQRKWVLLSLVAFSCEIE